LAEEVFLPTRRSQFLKALLPVPLLRASSPISGGAPKPLPGTLAFSASLLTIYVFETRYLGTRGLFLPMQVQLNRQATVNASNALAAFFAMPSQAILNSPAG
jgi:hypothetical protein